MLHEAARSFPGGKQPPEPRGRSRTPGIYSQPGELGAIPGSLRGLACRAWSLVPRVSASPPSPSNGDACLPAREFPAGLGLDGSTWTLQRLGCFLGAPAAPGSAGLPLWPWELGRGPGGHSHGMWQGVCGLQGCRCHCLSPLPLCRINPASMHARDPVKASQGWGQTQLGRRRPCRWVTRALRR